MDSVLRGENPHEAVQDFAMFPCKTWVSYTRLLCILSTSPPERDYLVVMILQLFPSSRFYEGGLARRENRQLKAESCNRDFAVSTLVSFPVVDFVV